MNFLRPKSIWNSMNEIVEEISFQVQFCEWRHAGRRSINARTQWTFFPDSLALTFNQRKPLCWIKASKVWSTLTFSLAPSPIYDFLYILYNMTCQSDYVWCWLWLCILPRQKSGHCTVYCVLCRRRWDNRQRNWTSPEPKPAWPGWDRDKTSWSIKLLSRSCSVNWPP